MPKQKILSHPAMDLEVYEEDGRVMIAESHPARDGIGEVTDTREATPVERKLAFMIQAYEGYIEEWNIQMDEILKGVTR